jgi:putative salt-induced outer membrane protein YdiY
MRGMFKALAAVVAAGLFSSPVLADEVIFRNGDKLSGKIVSAGDGKLTIKTAVAGTVEVELEDVKTFASDGPVSIKLKDGTIIRQPVAAAEQPGEVAVQAGAVAAQNVAITSIKSINQKETWTGSVVAGALITRGNSNTEAFNVSADATRRTDNDRLNLNGQYLFGRQEDPTTGVKSTSTDNWRLGAKYDYFFTEKFYAFGSFGVEKDRIANLDLRLTPAIGVGYQWIERKDFNFFTEAGLAYVYEDYEGEEANENISLKLAYHVDKKLSEGVRVFHNLAFYPSLENISDYYLLTDAGIRADLTESFFTEFKVELKYDSSPAEDSSRSDLRYILGVGWNF